MFPVRPADRVRAARSNRYWPLLGELVALPTRRCAWDRDARRSRR
jgi:hypothetical protein